MLTASAEDNRYTYTGREWDETLGLYHYRARMYDATEGRFCSRDPIGYEGSRWNVYEYVNGAPTIGRDPTGLVGPGPVGPWPGGQPTPPNEEPPVMHPPTGLPPEAACVASIAIPIAVAEPTPCGEVVAGVVILVVAVTVECSRPRPRTRECPPCPAPPSIPPDFPRIDRVPPSSEHFPCPGDHLHVYWWEVNQNPITCQCFNKKKEDVHCL